METKVEVLKYMFTRIQEMLPVKVVKAKKDKDYFTYIVENNCSIEFYIRTSQGGHAGKNTFCMGVTCRIRNPFLSKLISEPFNEKDTHDNLIILFSNLYDWYNQNQMEVDYFLDNKSDKTPEVERFLNDLEDNFFSYIIPFVKQYTRIIDFYTNPGHIQYIIGNRQFSLGVICSLLCKREEFIEEKLVPLAKASKEGHIFGEFFKCANYVTDIVEPIKKYITENNINFEQ
jgi:hypothetical protein